MFGERPYNWSTSLSLMMRSQLWQRSSCTGEAAPALLGRISAPCQMGDATPQKPGKAAINGELVQEFSSSKNVVLRHWTLIIGLSSTACSVLSLWLECYGSNFRAFWIRVSMSLPCKRVTWSSQQPSINPLKSHYDCFSHSWYSLIFLIPIWKFPEMGVPPSHPFYFRIFPSKPTGYWGIPNLGNPM